MSQLQQEQPLLPVRNLHNYAYCPRLFYLQWVENLWVENADTAAGSHLHRNIDKPSHWQEQIDLSDRASIRSISLESTHLGIRGVADLILNQADGTELIDYKRGAAHRGEDNQPTPKSFDAIQIAAYVLLLKEQNVHITHASIYYAKEKKRIPVELNQPLFDKVIESISAAKKLANSATCPPPLQQDPRCLHCSAYPVCLPNETNFWQTNNPQTPKNTLPPLPPSDEGEILVVQNYRAKLALRSNEILVKIDNSIVSKHPIEQIQAVYLYGAIQYSTQVVHTLLERSVPIAHFSPAGRFLGMTSGLPLSGIDARMGQTRLFHDLPQRTILTQEIIRAKIHNQRVLLMRNGNAPKLILKQLANLRDQTQNVDNLDTLRGIEGSAAALYFGHFSTMLKGTAGENFDFNGRNRRPPKDPLNALLSQGYSILAKELTGICHAIGLDPFIGFFHQPRYGRPALALDLMEEFRPLIADSVAITLLNRQELTHSDFQITSRGCHLTDNGRRQFWRAWFRRLDTKVKHPQFGYQMTYRRMLDVQSRQLWRYLRGDTSSYYAFTTR